MKRALLALVLVACGSPAKRVNAPVDELPPPNPIVAATEEDARACAVVASLGCPEAAMCLGVMSVARTDHITVPSACLAAAKTVDALRKCGDASTLTFDCNR